MKEFATILLDIIVPVFIIIGLGTLLHRKLQFDLKTLSNVNLYLFVPGIIFMKLYETKFSFHIFLEVFGYFCLSIAILYVISFLISRLLGHERPMRTAFSNSVLFYNSGNYGVPVNDLVFKSDPYAMSIQIMVLVFQNIFTFSYGVIILQSVRGFNAKVLLSYFKMPVFYAMMLGILLNVFHVSLPVFILTPARYISEGMIALMLITLGGQVAYLKIKQFNSSILISLILRLLMGPLVAIGIIYAFGISGVFAQALMISSAMPTSVNSSIIAQVYDNEPEFAAQIVFMSTLFSALTVSLVIYLSGVLF